jgi:hypothetical protein
LGIKKYNSSRVQFVNPENIIEVNMAIINKRTQKLSNEEKSILPVSIK